MTYNISSIRRILLVLLLLMVVAGSAWGQIVNITTGAIDSQGKVAEYNSLRRNYSVDVSSSIPLFNSGSWTGGETGGMVARNSQHWDGSPDNTYYEQSGSWGSTWTNSYSTRVYLSKGSYVLMGACRSSENAEAYISVNDIKVFAPKNNDNGTGVATNSEASFQGGIYANGNGRGWEYRYIKFEVTSDGSEVVIQIGGSSSVGQQYMSFTQPMLWKAVDVGDKFHEWSGVGAGSTITLQNPANYVWRSGVEVAAGEVIYGNSYGAVPANQYADLSQYDKLVVTYDNTKALPRFLFNKADDGTTLSVESVGDYMTIEGNQITIHLAKLASDNGGYAHLNCIKAPWGGSSIVYSARLENVERPVTISKTIAVGSDNTIRLDGNLLCDHIPYNYIRIELVDGSNNNKTLYAAGTGHDDSATFRVESQYGDKQGDYTNINNANQVYACASLGNWYDGVLVSSGTFVFNLPNRSNYAGNHLRIHLARYTNGSYGVYNPPEIEKTYDYMIWVAGNEAGAAVHQLYAANTGASSFDVDLYGLTNSGQDVANGLQQSAFTNLNNFYIRWYVADKVTHLPIVDENGSPISVNTPVLQITDGSIPRVFPEDIGLVVFFDYNYDGILSNSSKTQGLLNVHVELPNGLTQNDVELVALVTNDFSNSGTNIEPQNLKLKYVVSFEDNAEIQYKNLPFRHYKGVTGRDWVMPEGSTGLMTQEIWTADASYDKLQPTTNTNDPTKGSASQTTVDVRQSVHTWEYNVYISPADGQRALILPFENYMYGFDSSISSDGNDLEPRAYFRWYDWKTDQAVVTNSDYTFRACNSDILKPYMETVGGETRDRGLIALNLDPDHPTHSRIGVWLTVNADFATHYPDGIDIACDVSKYSDGIVVFGTNAYLEHEPTLSMRYIFHIYPGKKIADKLSAAKDNLNKARVALENPSLSASERLDLYTKLEYFGKDDINPMFDLPENEGRVVVSLGDGKSGHFSLRMDENLLENYKLWDNTNLVSADGVKWVAFYEDEKTGNVLRKELLTSTSRIQSFTYNDFTGTFYSLGTNIAANITDGMKFHVVGYVTKGDVNTLQGTGVYAPVAHYELQFLVAPPLSVAKLKSNQDNVRTNNIKRTDEYMVDHYDLKNVVDFDGNPETNKNLTDEKKPSFYSTSNWDDVPSVRGNNMSWMPREWTDIEYSYCYPQLCDYVINTNPNNTYWQYNHFLSPQHGDYMILKSMNITGISDQRVQPYELQWWWGSELYDYTHVYTDGNKYGSFLYTDASNESRTMITIPFTADLCGGSSIYFTAAVADMTNAQIKPQLLIRIVGIDSNGDRNQVVSFHTCDISTTGASTGEWYQIYGESTIPANFNDDIENFVCEVVNYADNTNGADFAIDQFQIYTNTAKVKLTQEEGGCSEESTKKTFIYADAEGIQALYGKTGTTKIYWRIHNEQGEVVTAEKMYKDDDLEGTGIYGEIEIPLDYTNHLIVNSAVVDEATVKANNDLYWFIGTDGKAYCKIAYRHLAGLLDGETYYVSIYDPGRQLSVGFLPENNSYWGGLNTAARSKCSVFSPFFIPRQQFVVYVNEAAGIGEGGRINMACDAAPVVTDLQMRLKKPDVSQPSGFTNIDDLHYDFFFGTMAQWTSNSKFDANYTYKQLREAVEDYRATYQNNDNYNSYSKIVDGVNYKNVLDAAIAANLLDLACSTTFSNNFNTRPSKDFTVVCLPIEQTIDAGSTAICSPFEVRFDIVWPNPEMELGFDDVDYSTVGIKRVIRVGLEQLNKMRTQGYKLHVPVSKYKDNQKQIVKKLYFPTESYLTISAVDKTNSPIVPNTTDPTLPAVGTKFAKIVPINSGESRPFVDKTHMYLSLDLSGDNCGIDFHEGYQYEVSISFFDEVEDGAASPCFGDLFLIIKVVPEFVTWHAMHVDDDGNPTETETDYWSANWYNDANWQRSVRSELYKDENVAGKTQNTATAGHPAGYDNNGEGSLGFPLSASSNPGFVPMKFTYVTLPTGNNAPSLINEPKIVDASLGKGSKRQGGGFLDTSQTTLLTDRSPNYTGTPRLNSRPTENIYYDMLVRYGNDEYGEGCFGHRCLRDDGTWDDQGDPAPTAKVFDVEKFYGNVCREIYFKPESELLRQHRLTYEKAWVEKELEANKWYLVSAPLKNTYAGDMYVPYSNGRQETEAFQAISFDKTKGYSRTAYPVYQRSWGANHGTIYVKENDMRAISYSANLNFSAVTTSLAEWGHVFNDVQVPYNTLTGFSIRAHKKVQTADALIRLPKADTSYEYYDWTDTNYDPAAETNQTSVKSVSKTNINRFVTDDHESDGSLTFNIIDMQQQDDYVLVGNPYMASIDMEKFFQTNSSLDAGYWTYEASVASAELTTGIIRPLQAFFVKKGSATSITFDKSMQIDGNFPTAPSGGGGARSAAMTISASNGYGTSSARIEMKDQASLDYVSGEDVETLFDSNLSDVPMVYTVAGSRAVSIDSRPSMDIVPFGVVCANSNEPVNCQLSTVTSPLYLFDAVTGSVTEVGEGSTFAVQPNDYGRYFLTTSGDLTGVKNVSATDGIIVSVRDRQLTVRSTSELKSVRVLTTGGETIQSMTGYGKETSISLAVGGVFIIEAQTENDRKTYKVIVK